MKKVSDIMTSDVYSVNLTDTILQARMMMKDKDIRHLPVIDNEGLYVGLLTQSSLLNYSLNMIESFGLSGLEKREIRTAVKEIMSTDVLTVEPSVEIISIGELFTKKKVSCLPIVEKKQLVGMLTSVDFVRLAIQLLK